ncbi:MAG: leucine-rich repeat domain-containing protein [Holosporales bacterium]|jgi:hypothetical protein|nr:leucine-rich repeat domain-containing protein [Holosporales bacterium]
MHSDLYPFLRYRFNEDNITGIELNVDSDCLDKATYLTNGNFAHIAIAMEKLPYPIPKPWLNNLRSFTAPKLKHIRVGAFSGTYDDHYKMQLFKLSAVESIGASAFSFDSISLLELSNALKFIDTAYIWEIQSVAVPHFTHFLCGNCFGHLYQLSASDLFRVSDSPVLSIILLNITCHSRINNIRKLLDTIDISIYQHSFKNINIKISDSIKHIVDVAYINEILAMDSTLALLDSMVSNEGYGFLDISNTTIPENNLRSITVGSLPWVLSLPRITTVNASFNPLFRKLHGVILFDAESVTNRAFTDCSHFTTLGFRDTTTFSGTPLTELTPSIFELTVTQPKNISSFLSALERAGLALSSVEKFIIKFPNSLAQSTNLGSYVASLLADWPSSFSGNTAVSSTDNILYFDLSNSCISDISEFPINKLSREYSCIFTLPNGLCNFMQSNNETTLNTGTIAEKDLIKTAILSENLLAIPDRAFAGAQLTSVTIPDSVTTIGEGAFYKTQLTSVTIPNSVTTIGQDAFNNCEQLTSVTTTDSVTIPNSVTTIGDGAFSYCKQLTSVTIPDPVTTIGNAAFYGCTQLTSVTIPDSVTTIGRSAFYGCTQLTSVTIPNSVTTIGERAFSSCPQLTSVTISNSVTTIGWYAFERCTQLTSITIPNSVTTIADGAFYHCTQLTSVTIPDSVTTIGSWAFSYCSQLTSVTIPDSVTTIGICTFFNCPIQSIKINCSQLDNRIIAALSNVLPGFTNWQEVTTLSALNTLQVVLSPSLLESFGTDAGLKEYVSGILRIDSPTDNAIISAIAGKQEKLFELDLSNTDLVQADIDGMAKTLPWRVIFKNGQVDYATQR